MKTSNTAFLDESGVPIVIDDKGSLVDFCLFDKGPEISGFYCKEKPKKEASRDASLRLKDLEEENCRLKSMIADLVIGRISQ